jgi:hypothetical protein
MLACLPDIQSPEKAFVANWRFPSQCVLLVIYLAEDGVLHSVLCLSFHNCHPRTLDLDICCATCFLFPGDEVESSPEIVLMLALNYCADVIKGLLVLFPLRYPFPFLQVLSSEPFTVFLVEEAFLFACLQPK